MEQRAKNSSSGDTIGSRLAERLFALFACVLASDLPYWVSANRRGVEGKPSIKALKVAQFRADAYFLPSQN